MKDLVIKNYSEIPQSAMDIRIKVFVEEQGFFDDIDDMDAVATHLLAFENETPVGTCRVFTTDGKSFVMGRLAVLKDFRNCGIGAALLKNAEECVKRLGGSQVRIHSQLQAKGFYEFCGYTVCGDVEEEQGHPHIWLKKDI